MGAWNEFLGPLIYLRDQAKFPLSLGLFAVRIDESQDWTLLMAGNVLMTLPMVLMFVLSRSFGADVGGFFSAEYINAPWSWGKVADLAAHLYLPVFVLAVHGTASLVRIMRANLLDELNKPYVTTVRAAGLPAFYAERLEKGL